MTTQTDRLTRIRWLESIILRVLPEYFVCAECGPFVKVDEDGCCWYCGRGTKVRKAINVLRRRKHDA